jgi:hypothetical protein
MSTYYSLACPIHKKDIHIGSDSIFYEFCIFIDERETMENLNKFLFVHKDCKPVFISEHDPLSDECSEEDLHGKS